MNRVDTFLRAKWLITLLGCAGFLGCNDILGFRPGYPYPPDAGNENTDAHTLDTGDAASSNDTDGGELDVNSEAGIDGSAGCTASGGINGRCKCAPDSTQPCETHPGTD